MTLGDRIRDARKRKGLTLDELAKSINSTKQSIYKYESGIVTNIPSDKLEIIASRLGVSEAYLMGWEPEYVLQSENSDDLKRLIEISSGLPADSVSRLLQFAEALRDINAAESNKNE